MGKPLSDASILEAAALFQAAQYPAILTGAGISAESGIPTFRGEEGLWKSYRAEELATPEAFRRDPTLVWEWYNWRREIVLSKKPNAGHYAINDLQSISASMPVITQNVDGLHRKSGNQNIYEMHGNIFRARCTSCRAKIDQQSTDDLDPRCQRCGSLMRPDIVWFGETLDPVVISGIMRHLERCDLLLVVGTSGVVYPAAGFSSVVDDHGGKIIEINVEPVTPFALQLAGKSGEVLPAFVAALGAL